MTTTRVTMTKNLSKSNRAMSANKVSNNNNNRSNNNISKRFFGSSSSSSSSSSSLEFQQLKLLNKQNKSNKVVELFETNRVNQQNEKNLSEYLKALVATNRLNESAMLETLQRGQMMQPHSAAASAFGRQRGGGEGGDGFAGAAAANAAMMAKNNYGASGSGGWQFPTLQGFSKAINDATAAANNTGGVGGNASGGAAAAATNALRGSSSSASGGEVLGTPKSPLFVQHLEPTFPAQVWRTIRTLGLAFVVLSGVGALIEDKGGPVGRSLLGNSDQPKPQNQDEFIEESDGKGGKIRRKKKTTFSDVKGVDEAKNELKEIVHYLRDPKKFTRLGGKLPKGLLLVGPPGTGKTLLAKAVAGEADVPFFYVSGSEFEEMFVGVGARRVRELFKAAKKQAPCIVFIDEIDAVGSQRSPKDAQNTRMTLNQLLTEMDGFNSSDVQGIVVLAATNTPEALDKALVRPGRFDRTVAVPNPDVEGRKQILQVHSKNVKLAKDVDFEIVARGTPGFSGADLANLVNIAALKAALDDETEVKNSHLDHAKDRILMGAERKSAVITEENRKLTAYHEGGHALVALRTQGARPVHKATIVPRGHALGMVMQLPDKDELNLTRKQLMAMLDVTMGGRVAEELIFGKDEITTGASSDLQQATRLAREMITKYGFSQTIGLASQEYNQSGLSSETRQKIEEEVKEMLESAYVRAKTLLRTHEKELHAIAKSLLDRESLTGDELKEIILGAASGKSVKNINNNNNASSVASADIKIKVDGARGVKTAAVN
jgi:ATP-dependent metalloprotease